MKKNKLVSRKLKMIKITFKKLKTKLCKGKRGKRRFHFKKLLFSVVILGGLYLIRNQFIVATVNRRPITRWQLLKTLEKQSGNQTLDNLITEILISQEARKEEIVITPKEIEEEIKKIKENFTAQGQDFEVLLEMQGINAEELSKQIRIQKILEKMVGQDIEITPEEVDEYLETNKEFLPEDQSPEELEKQATENLKQQKMGLAVQAWLADLKEKAKINYLLEL